MVNPYPAIHDLYRLTKSWHSCCGLSPLEKSIHSSRFDFSSVHTQHGYNLFYQSFSSPIVSALAAHLDFLSCLSLRLQLGGEIRGLHGRL